MNFVTEVNINGIDAELEIEITHYQPYKWGRFGHPDDQSEDQQEEVEFDVYYYGKPFKDQLSHHVLNFLEDKAKSFARKMK